MDLSVDVHGARWRPERNWLTNVSRKELLEEARRDGLEVWPRPHSWADLLAAASEESDDFAPATAVIWETLWRFDPALTPQSWKDDGPPAEDDHLNPYLSKPLLETDVQAVYQLESLDAEAAEIYAEAARAERLQEWPNASRLMETATRLRDQLREPESSATQNEIYGSFDQPLREIESTTWTPARLLERRGLADVLDDYERL